MYSFGKITSNTFILARSAPPCNPRSSDGREKSGNPRTIGKRTHMRTIRTLVVFLALAIPVALFGQISVRIRIAPPMLPVYEQPICPGDGYL